MEPLTWQNLYVPALKESKGKWIEISDTCVTLYFTVDKYSIEPVQCSGCSIKYNVISLEGNARINDRPSEKYHGQISAHSVFWHKCACGSPCSCNGMGDFFPHDTRTRFLLKANIDEPWENTQHRWYLPKKLKISDTQ